MDSDSDNNVGDNDVAAAAARCTALRTLVKKKIKTSMSADEIMLLYCYFVSYVKGMMKKSK